MGNRDSSYTSVNKYLEIWINPKFKENVCLTVHIELFFGPDLTQDHIQQKQFYGELPIYLVASSPR